MVDMEAGKTVIVALKSSTSAECREALQWAINFFVKAGVDQVILAHIVKIPDLIPTPKGPMPLAWAEDQCQADYIQEEGRKAAIFLEEYQAVCKQQSVKASITIRCGTDREPVMLEIVEEVGATHLVMGTGGRTGFSFRKKGLTARVAKKARCSVFLVNSRGELLTSQFYDGKRGVAGSGAKRGLGKDMPGQSAAFLPPIIPPSTVSHDSRPSTPANESPRSVVSSSALSVSSKPGPFPQGSPSQPVMLQSRTGTPDSVTATEAWVNRQGQRVPGSVPEHSEYVEGETMGREEDVRGSDELADVLRKLQLSEAATARLQAQQANYERQLREVEASLAKEAAEKERQEKELIKRRKPQSQCRVYSFRELEAATDDFSPAKLLGEGGFGKVYLGRLEHRSAAIKVLNPEGLQGPDEFQREVEILSGLRHPHIVMLMGCCPERGCLVYEYCANGSLEDRLARRDHSASLDYMSRIRIAFEVAIALRAMHTSRPMIIHKDLKPSNILLDQHLTAKLGDVGMARVAPELATTVLSRAAQGSSGNLQTLMFDTRPQGTLLYMDPEYLQQGTFNQKSDVYAFGICLLQLLTNRPPQQIVGAVEDALNQGRVMALVDRTAGSWPEEVATKVAKLGLRCATMLRRDRADLAKEVLPELEAVCTAALEAASREASRGLYGAVNGGEDALSSVSS
ncbi:Serine Threonine protein kinase [Klebsormidium nitens]|uniref:Serine Threonine protein kinase n=1 Tax=Klebsormidium nitens TaxID=105231 RepID=A0A1Y1I1G7_KLENI|nr:Serine Threonine protein kinase [Klebsormidium nitens]|eukprot:GAQ84750.1 Serine Threonine protein kinase [Klebsormidium nitens]